MKILLWTDNLFTRTQLEGTWRSAGAEVFVKEVVELPELIVVDLNAADAVEHICSLREEYPDTELLVFGPHVDGTAFKAARAAGATSQVARGKVVERVLSRLSK